MTIGLLLFAAGVGLLAGIVTGRNTPRLSLSATLMGLAAGFGAGFWALAGGENWNWRGELALGGEPLHLHVDALSGFFLVLLCIIGGAATVYGYGYWNEKRHPLSAASGRGWWGLMLLSMGFVFVCANGLHFLIAWELFALSAYFLITLDRQRREVRAAGWLYLTVSHAGTLCLFAYFAAIAARTGSWELGPMRENAGLAPLFWLALAGFGLKAGAFPLHVWLPSAHANAPSHVSALLSGVAIKLGVFGIVRFSGWLPLPEGAGWAVTALGVVSAVLGVAFALGQHDLKRLLAYHSVENIGIILIGVGFAIVSLQHGFSAWGALALAGGVLHVWNHGLFKALLFFGAGSVLHATGTREMSRLGGLWKRMPWTAGLFAIGAAAISGLPPLNGFVSEWLVFLGLFDAAITHVRAAWMAIPAAVLLGVTGALALACFIKVCGIVFLGAPRTREAEQAHESGPAMLGAMRLLATLCLFIGLFPWLLWPLLSHVIVAWNPLWTPSPGMPASLDALGAAHLALAVLCALAAWWLWRRSFSRGVVLAPTWDCGYAAPDARMQYTAGSFAGIIVDWFSWILRPKRHVERPDGPFPTRAQVERHTPETVLDLVLAPAARGVLWGSANTRRLQHGRVQAYLLYLVAGLLMVTVFMRYS